MYRLSFALASALLLFATSARAQVAPDNPAAPHPALFEKHITTSPGNALEMAITPAGKLQITYRDDRQFFKNSTILDGRVGVDVLTSKGKITTRWFQVNLKTTNNNTSIFGRTMGLPLRKGEQLLNVRTAIGGQPRQANQRWDNLFNRPGSNYLMAHPGNLSHLNIRRPR